MSSHHRLVAVLILISFLSLTAYAQSAGPEVTHFSADGISFDYPVGCLITDLSSPEEQHYTLTQKGSSVQIMIVAKRGFVRRSELPAALASFTEPFVQEVTMEVGRGKSPPVSTPIQTQVGAMEAEGVRLRSSGIKKSAEVMWFRMNFRLIGLAFVRLDVDESPGSQLWKIIRSSLGAEPPVITVKAAEAQPSQSERIEGGVLNGKALELPQPPYPALARAAHASGTVVVQVIIDEQGNVSAAHAISGHPLLQAASVAVARQAKFTPTLWDGEPVKVTGVIQYNFVAQ